MIKKLPHKIKYNSKISYTVSVVPNFDDKEQLGLCDPNKKQISLSANQSDDELISTLWHEILHLCSMEHPDDLCLTERQVEILELELVKLFRRNPKFFDLFIDLVRKKL